MAELEPTFIERMPPPLVRALGKVLRDRFASHIPGVEEGLQELATEVIDPGISDSIRAAQASEGDLVGYIGDLARAKSASVDFYNDRLLRLNVDPSPVEEFLPDGLNVELSGPSYAHLIDALDHEVNTRIQKIKRAQLAHKIAPTTTREVTAALHGLEHELDDLNAAQGIRLTSEKEGHVLNAVIYLYDD